MNVRITAVRKLAVEAADDGLLAPELASGIARLKGVPTRGVRVGNWLSLSQAQALLDAPNTTTVKGLRDRAMFAVLLGCGLRCSEVAGLTTKHIQQRDGRWRIVDLVGKHGRVRTVPMPAWVKNALDAWTTGASIESGHLFRRIQRGGRVYRTKLSEKIVWQTLKKYVAGTEIPNIAPHDLRRTTAKLCRAAGGSWNRFSYSLGIHPYKPRNAISERSKIWCMRQTMGSS